MKTFKPKFRPKRFYDCRTYHECLDRAARALETSLPCKSCSHYEPVKAEADDAELNVVLYQRVSVLKGEE